MYEVAQEVAREVHCTEQIQVCVCVVSRFLILCEMFLFKLYPIIFMKKDCTNIG